MSGKGDKMKKKTKKTYSLSYPGGVYASEQKQSFARSVVVGNLVFCSGASGRLLETGFVRTDNATVQTVDALDKIKVALEEAGTSLENIVKVFVFIKDVEKDRDAVWLTYWDYLRKHAPSLADEMPAATCIGGVRLAEPSYLVEIDVIACLPD